MPKGVYCSTNKSKYKQNIEVVNIIHADITDWSIKFDDCDHLNIRFQNSIQKAKSKKKRNNQTNKRAVRSIPRWSNA